MQNNTLYKSSQFKARTGPKPSQNYGFLRLLRRTTHFTSFRDLRLELVLSPIIVNTRYKRVLNHELNYKYVLNHKYIPNNNPYTNNTSLSLKIWLQPLQLTKKTYYCSYTHKTH